MIKNIKYEANEKENWLIFPKFRLRAKTIKHVIKNNKNE